MPILRRYEVSRIVKYFSSTVITQMAYKSFGALWYLFATGPVLKWLPGTLRQQYLFVSTANFMPNPS